jgi:hypothetical protein
VTGDSGAGVRGMEEELRRLQPPLGSPASLVELLRSGKRKPKVGREHAQSKNPSVTQAKQSSKAGDARIARAAC